MNYQEQITVAFDTVDMVQGFDASIKAQRYSFVAKGLESITECKGCAGKSAPTYVEVIKAQVELAGKEARAVLFTKQFEAAPKEVAECWVAFRETLVKHLMGSSPCPAHMTAARMVEVMATRQASVRHALSDFVVDCKPLIGYIETLMDGGDIEEVQFVSGKLKQKVADALPTILNPDNACAPQAS